MRKRKNRKRLNHSVVTETIKLLAALISLLTALVKLLADE